jgi:hypothetical protein
LKSGSARPTTRISPSIANPFSSGSSEDHRFLKGVSPRPATRIANPFSSEGGHR